MFDLLVIGSGPGGYRAAVLAAQRGLSVAIAERDQWGGACLNRGCVPKKTWYSTARLAAAAPGFAERGLRDLQYYNGDVHRALFALPNYVRDLVG